MVPFVNGVKDKLKAIINKIELYIVYRRYKSKFFRFSFVDLKCSSLEQFEASITRLYHTVEKGLSYEKYRAGFGKDTVQNLVSSLQQYIDHGYTTDAFFYTAALSCLYEYIDKNKEYGYIDRKLEEKVKNIPGSNIHNGGAISISAPDNPELMTYDTLVKSRHSIRHFSSSHVDKKLIKEAVELAQYTPSACNRQGWRTRIVSDKSIVKEILSNQNGNRGFGEEIDKILVITADLRYQQRSRELFQAYIDGGMYAESVLNSLFFKGIGTIPLSAALTPRQEARVRKSIGLDDAEVLILFIGIGNYPQGTFLTTMSKRKNNVDIKFI